MTTPNETGIVNKIGNKLQSKKFWLMVAIFVSVNMTHFGVSWLFRSVGLVSEDTLVKLFDLGTSVLNTTIVAYLSAVTAEKIVNKVLDRIASKIGG